MQKMTCFNCQKLFSYKKDSKKNRKYCSFSCKKDYLSFSKKIKCGSCQNIFTIYQKSHVVRKFCSRLCSDHSKRTTKDDFLLSMLEYENDCWIYKGATNGGGYGIVRRLGKNLAAHRYSYEIHKGKIPKNKFVCHTCDNRRCVNPNHLFLGTQKENMRDMIRKGRKVSSPGTKNGMSKLSNLDVINIYKNDTNLSVKELAIKYNVCIATINRIKNKKSWMHITEGIF